MGSPRSPPQGGEAESPRGLKAAVLELRAARLDAVCSILREAAVERNADRISAVRSLVANTGAHLSEISANAADLKQGGFGSVRELALSRVSALGLVLLERTEAALDLLLPPSHDIAIRRGGACAEEDDDVDADTGGSSSSTSMPWHMRIPRVLPFQMLHSMSLQLSQGSSTLRVKLLLMQDTCAMVVRRLNVNEIWQLLKATVPFSESQRQLANVVLESPAASRASQLAQSGCERILATRIGHLLKEAGGAVRILHTSRLARREGSSQAATVTVEEPVQPSRREAHGDGSPSDGAAGPKAGEGGGHADEVLHPSFRLIIKNSFIEIVQEDPRPVRRARSCDAAIQVEFSSPTPRELASASSAKTPAPAARPAQSSGVGAEAPASPQTSPRGAGADGAPAEAEAAAAAEEPEQTTVMLRGFPQEYARSQLLEALDGAGFTGTYDFVYLPVDFTRGTCLGYALIGVQRHADAQRLLQHFHGTNLPGVLDGTLCEASWSEPSRTLDEHIERYRNSPVMHPSMPDDYKPVIFREGQRVEFPAPTKPIRAPRIRHLKAAPREPGVRG